MDPTSIKKSNKTLSSPSKITDFQKKVFKHLPKKGGVITYKELADKINSHPRAIARALATNPYPIKIPCHRVIKSDGTIGGYSGKGGIKTKINLLKKEGVNFENS